MSDIKNYVEVHFSLSSVHVDGEVYTIEGVSVDLLNNPPNKKEKITTIVWDKNHPNQTRLSFSEAVTEGGSNLIFFGEEKYNDWVQPFVDLWQAEKDRIEHEQEEAEAERNKPENRQARALTQLNSDFETVKERAHLKSSLGFEVDANSTAKENVQGLIEEVGTGTVQFCDYYNQFHELNKAQLETLKSEINQNGQALYAQKWEYRTAIEACTDNEGLDAVVAGIEFTYMDFTPKDETDEGTTETDQTTDGATE